MQENMYSKRKLPTLIFIAIIALSAKAQKIGDSLNAFAIDLLTATSLEPNSPPNLALSPYTVWTLLSIIDEGARGNTAKQIEKVLRIPDLNNKGTFRNDFTNMSSILAIKDQDVNLDIYNAIYTTARQKLNTQFRDLSQNYYRVKVQPIDFSNVNQASEIINKYVTQATRNRISNFIQPNDLLDAQIFMISALYFKGNWMLPFNKSATYRDTFFDEKENKLGEVDMMFQMGFFPYTRLDHLKGYAVELPYGKGDKMSMVVILPYGGQTLRNMLQLMTQNPFSMVLDMLDTAKDTFEGEDVKVYLPRFSVKSDLTLNAVLHKMGLTDVFDENTADLLGMFPHYLYITRLIQKAEIDVTEEGTVAVAASGASVQNKSPPPKFLANKPFLYFIVNKPTRSIMFAGKVSSPP